MKKVFVPLLILLCSRGAFAAAPTRLRIAFDMQNVTMGNFGPTAGFGEMLQILLRDPRVEIYFYSTQSYRGVQSQLRGVRLPDGRTADEVGKIIEGERMTDLDEPTPPPAKANDGFGFGGFGDRGFPHRYKDLRVISPDPTDFANTVLVDDDDFKAHPNQLGHLLWLPTDIGRPAYVKPAYIPPAPAAPLTAALADTAGATPPAPVAGSKPAVPAPPKSGGWWSRVFAEPADPKSVAPKPAPTPAPVVNDAKPPAANAGATGTLKDLWTRFLTYVDERPDGLPELRARPARPPREKGAPYVPRSRDPKPWSAAKPAGTPNADPYAPASSAAPARPAAAPIAWPPRPVATESNDRSNIMLGALQAAILDADLRQIGLAQALREIVWMPTGPDGEMKMKLRLDNPGVTEGLKSLGAEIRAEAKCEFKFVEEPKRGYW